MNMKNLAPHILRQRLLIEGFYSRSVDAEVIKSYLYGIANHLNLKTYGKPTIFSPSSLGKEENQGFDAFIPLIDSGISAYIWSKSSFLSIVIYTCKSFDQQAAIDYTKEFFQVLSEVAYMQF